MSMPFENGKNLAEIMFEKLSPEMQAGVIAARLRAKTFFENITKIERMSYREYLKSDAWIEKSNNAKMRAGNRCQLCNNSGNLHTHHRTYERRGRELDSDLIVLCSDCHAKFHDKAA